VSKRNFYATFKVQQASPKGVAVEITATSRLADGMPTTNT
jgi:hypothetical protein